MPTYAIIESGAKQYRVEPKSWIEVEKLNLAEGEKEVALDKVLLLCNGEKIQIGTPHIQGAKVICDYLGNKRAPKVISFKFRRRKASRRKKGHRQEYSRLFVKEILAGK